MLGAAAWARLHPTGGGLSDFTLPCDDRFCVDPDGSGRGRRVGHVTTVGQVIEVEDWARIRHLAATHSAPRSSAAPDEARPRTRSPGRAGRETC